MNAIVQPWQLAAHDPVATTTQRRPRLFRGLSGRQMTQVRRTFDDDRFADGDPVPRPGTLAPHVGIVLTGALREDVMPHDGPACLFGLTFPGEMLSPVGRHSARSQLHAMGATRLMSCDAETFARLMDEIPRLRMNYLAELQDRLAEARRWQVLLGRKTAVERVASMLFWFWDRLGQPEELELGLSRAELGQMANLTFETVSRQIKALEQAGALALPQPSRIRVRDPQALFEATGEVPPTQRAA